MGQTHRQNLRETERFFVAFTWQKGHVIDKFPQLIENGTYTVKEAEWHDQADKLAEQASESANIYHNLIVKASERALLAKLTHRMYLDIWEVRIKELEGEIEEENMEQVWHEAQIEHEIMHQQDPHFHEMDFDGLDNSVDGQTDSSSNVCVQYSRFRCLHAVPQADLRGEVIVIVPLLLDCMLNTPGTRGDGPNGISPQDCQ